MPSRPFNRSAVLLLGLLPACTVTASDSGGGEMGPTGPGDDVMEGGEECELDAFETDLVAAMCSREVTCCTSSELQRLYDVFGHQVTDEASCAQANQDLIGPIASRPLDRFRRESIAAGRIVYHADLACQCVRDLRDIACPDWGERPSRPASCRATFEGIVAAGGTCTLHEDCATGWCQGSSFLLGAGGSFELEPGICATPPGIGKACVDFTCADDLVCDDRDETCKAPKANGSECGFGYECRSGYCRDNTTCDAPPDLACDGQS